MRWDFGELVGWSAGRGSECVCKGCFGYGRVFVRGVLGMEGCLEGC